MDEKQQTSLTRRLLPAWAVLALVLLSSVLTLSVSWLLWGGSEDSSATAALTVENRPSGPVPAPTLQAGRPPTPAAQAASGDWRDAEYAKIARLRGGLSFEHFRDVLGVPMFVKQSSDGRFTQHLFQGRGYWVQAVSDVAGTVQLMAITSCREDFQPSFGGVPGSSPNLSTIVLNKSHLKDSGTAPGLLRYFASGATANSYFYDEYSMGNPGHYKTYFVGINDACPSMSSNDSRSAFLTSDYTQKPYDPGDTAVEAFRVAAVANTYAETAVFADRSVLESFQIGADRILVRTAPPYPEPK